MYRKADERYPISNYFSDIKIMKNSQRIYPEDEAKYIEAYIMNGIKGDNPYFHNWREQDQISGITEMRIWNYDEFLKSLELLDEACRSLKIAA
jgi:hypothetical protein